MTVEKYKQSEINDLQEKLMNAKELHELGQFNDALNIADFIYQKSQRLKNSILTFDALMILIEIPTQLGNIESIPNLFSQAEILLQNFRNDLLKGVEIKEADLLRIKGTYHFVRGELDEALELLKQALIIQKKVGNKREIAQILGLIGDNLGLSGEPDEALNYIQQSQIICEEIDLKSRKIRNLIGMSAIFYTYGDIKKSLENLNKGRILAENINHKPWLAIILNNLCSLYLDKGDSGNAMKIWEQGLAITEEIGFKFIKVSLLDFIIQLAVLKGDRKQAEEKIHILKEIYEQDKTKHHRLLYLFNKALVLKMSLRARNRADAEDLLKKIIDEIPGISETKIMSLLNLCDLLIKELQITGYNEVLDELQQYLSQLLDISEHLHSYLFIAETYLLQARISLLTLNLKEAKRFFTQARQIAEKWGFISLSSKISKEKDEFLKQINKWENLKEKDAPLNERLELIQFDEQIERMLQNRSQLTGKIIEEKVDIHKEKKICMICKGDVSGYIYVCECDAIYCENCIKALIDLENACWVCETPIDQSKPIKHVKKEEVENKNKNKLE